mmetsp:Transcript_92900/g.215919  ORF Transcript_92900/g.215919 Transcript_92900/m.215919 type:complete len:91 (-) Transcript_92900:149-421(-)
MHLLVSIRATISSFPACNHFGKLHACVRSWRMKSPVPVPDKVIAESFRGLCLDPQDPETVAEEIPPIRSQRMEVADIHQSSFHLTEWPGL